MAVYPGRDIERQALACDAAAGPECPAHSRGAEAPPRANIVAVVPGSPADDAGFAPGCCLTSVDGHALRDLIDWRWLSSEDEISVGYVDADGEEGVCELWREEGESWGFEFDGLVFDSVRQCRNACSFCFMRQLPKEARSSLTLRDDDYRLSFLCGTFVTFTNVRPEDERRIVEQSLSPLRFSLHVSDPEVRRTMIGRHAQHGLDVLDRLLSQGIQVHAQIVLVPGQNDGEVLEQTLRWAFEREGILDVCVVPLGFTKHQETFSESFGSPEAALDVLRQLEPFQRQALAQRGSSWVYAADEFYLNAYGADVLEHLPAADFYGDFEMFEDGVGIVRTCVDDWKAACSLGHDRQFAQAAQEAGVTVHYMAGCAMEPYFGPLIDGSHAAGYMKPLYVKNRYFGGNVNVTGLLVAADILDALEGLAAQCAHGSFASGRIAPIAAVPAVIFNDQGVTLDGCSFSDMEKAASESGIRLVMVSCLPTEFFPDIIAAIERMSAAVS